MQDMFDFFEKLDHTLGAVHEKTLQAAQQSPVGDGKERLSEMLRNVQQARGELQQIVADEKRLFEEDEAHRRRFAQPQPTPIWEIRPPQPKVHPPEKSDLEFGRTVRDRLLNEFCAGTAPTAERHTFDSWIESSLSIAPGLNPAEGEGLVRDVHQQALIFAPREAIWWACISAVHVLQRVNVKLPTQEMQQIDHASRWVAGLPTDEGAAAPLLSVSSGIQTVGDAVTLAVALASHRAPAIGNRQYELPQEAAAAAILFAGNLVPREQRSEVLREIVQLGADVASGKRLWPAAEQKRSAVKQHEESWSSWLHNSRG